MSDEERFRAEAIALVADAVRGDKRTQTWAGAINAYAVRETERRLRGEALIREMLTTVGFPDDHDCGRGQCAFCRAERYLAGDPVRHEASQESGGQ